MTTSLLGSTFFYGQHGRSALFISVFVSVVNKKGRQWGLGPLWIFHSFPFSDAVRWGCLYAVSLSLSPTFSLSSLPSTHRSKELNPQQARYPILGFDKLRNLYVYLEALSLHLLWKISTVFYACYYTSVLKAVMIYHEKEAIRVCRSGCWNRASKEKYRISYRVNLVQQVSYTKGFSTRVRFLGTWLSQIVFSSSDLYGCVKNMEIHVKRIQENHWSRNNFQSQCYEVNF